MPNPVRTLYALDPTSRHVRIALQVDPEGWLDSEVEPLLARLVQVANAAQVKVAFAVSCDSSFVLRCNPSNGQFEVDEIDTSELLSPHPLHPDPARLVDAVLEWCKAIAEGSPEFLRLAQLPKRVPEIAPLLRGALLEIRQSSEERS